MTIDLVILNGRLWTMDEARPKVEALAISAGKIVKLGRTADVKALRGRKTRVIDAGGATVLPGFIEGHMHVFGGGAEAASLDLQGVSGIEELRARLTAFAAANGESKIIIGNQANYTILGGGEVLTRRHLDRILPQRPVLLYAPDHHTAWANSKALELASILKGRALPPGHEIVMGADGFATGELREPLAIGPVADLATEFRRSRLGLATGGEPEPYPSPQDFAKDLEVMHGALKRCAAFGITSFHNMDGNLYTLELLAALEREGELLARARVPFHFKPFMPVAALERASTMAKAYASPLLSSGLVKMFMDGVIDSGTAVLREDYADRPGWRGDPLFTQAQFNEVATEADRRGLQIAVHAIGDGAVHMVLNGYEAARRCNGVRDSRHRVEHIEVVDPGDIARFPKLGVIASMQPPHPPGSQGLPLEPTLGKIGKARWPHAYAWNKFRKANVPLVFGTDWPVSDLNPMRSIHAAVTRKAWDETVDPQRQTLQQAIHSYTAMGAYAEFAEGRKGILKKGALGDVVVLDRDLGSCDPDELQNVKPQATIMGGRVVFEN